MAEVSRRAAALVFALLLLPGLSLAGEPYAVESLAGEEWYPSPEEWTYHYVYHYPRIASSEGSAA